MTNKITEDTIKKLIEQVLKEEQLNEFQTIKWKNDTAKDARDALGAKGTDPTKADIDKVTSRDNDVKNLSKKDIDAAASIPALKPILQKLAKNSSPAVGAYINQVLAAQGPIDALGDTQVPDISPDDSPLEISNDGVSVDKRSFDQPLGRVDPAAAYDINKTANQATGKPSNQVGVDSTLYNVFRAVPGNDLAAKLSYLKGVADLIENDESLEGVKDNEIFKISNAMMVFSNLANLSKTMGGSEAGFVMEAMLAGLIMGFKPPGKGTSDVISYLDKEKVFFSSKFTMKGGSNSWDPQHEIGMKDHLRMGPVYYVFIQKEGSPANATKSQGYNTLNVYITRLNKIGPRQSALKHVKAEQLNSSGDFVTLTPAFKKTGTSPEPNYNKNNPFLKIPVLKDPSTSYVKVGEQVANYIENDSENPLFKSILDAAQRLQNMQKNTEEYRAAKASGKSGQLSNGTASAKDYVNAVATDYTDIKSSFKKIFSSDLGSQKAFNESKVITANFLKKLISESFKK